MDQFAKKYKLIWIILTAIGTISIIGFSILPLLFLQ